MDSLIQKAASPFLTLGVAKKLKSSNYEVIDTKRGIVVRQLLQNQKNAITGFYKKNRFLFEKRVQSQRQDKRVSQGDRKRNLRDIFNNRSRLYMSGIINSRNKKVLPKVYRSSSKIIIEPQAKENKKENSRKSLHYSKLYKRTKSNLTIKQSFRLKGDNNYLVKPNKNQDLFDKIDPDFAKLYKNNEKTLNRNPLDNKVHAEFIKYKNDMLVIGGFGVEFSDELVLYNQKMDRFFVKHDSKFIRIKFATLPLQNKLLVHGGETPSKRYTSKVRNDLLILDIKSFNMHVIKDKDGKLPFKKGHIMFLIGSDVYFEGGKDFNNEPDSAIFAFNLKNRRVREITISNKLPWLNHHKCCTVGQTQSFDNFNIVLEGKSQNNLKKVYRSSKQKQLTTVSSFNNGVHIEQKVFCFGGLDKENVSKDILYMYKLVNNELRLSRPETLGRSPKSRYDHQMTYIQKIHSVIVMGGKHKLKKGIEEILDDLWLLQADKLIWIRINIYLTPRYAFSLTTDNNDLLIFGGYSENNLVDGMIRRIELDKRIADKFSKFFNIDFA